MATYKLHTNAEGRNTVHLKIMSSWKNTCDFDCLPCPAMFAIMLALEELGEKPSHGGANMSLVHWMGIKLRLSFSHHAVPNDHHLIIKPFSEKATRPCR